MIPLKKQLFFCVIITALSTGFTVHAATPDSATSSEKSFWQVLDSADQCLYDGCKLVGSYGMKAYSGVSNLLEHKQVKAHPKIALAAAVTSAAAIAALYEYMRYHYDQPKWKENNPKKAQAIKRAAAYTRTAASLAKAAIKPLLVWYVIRTVARGGMKTFDPVFSAVDSVKARFSAAK